MSGKPQQTYYHYRSGSRNSYSTKHFSDKVIDHNKFSDKTVDHFDTFSDRLSSEKASNRMIKVPEPLPRQSKMNEINNSNTFSNLERHSSTSSIDKVHYFSNFSVRPRSRSADFEEMNNKFNSKVSRENSEIRTFDRLQNYRLEKNFVIYTEQPANGFTGTYQNVEQISPVSNKLAKRQTSTNGLRGSVQVLLLG